MRWWPTYLLVSRFTAFPELLMDDRLGLIRPARHRLRAMALVAIVSAMTLSACGGGQGSDEEKKAKTGAASTDRKRPQARPAEVEELASAMGCTADITTDVDDYKQGVCATDKAQYVFVSFATDAGKRDWLDAAQMYGGVYLVGKRWVLSAKPKKYMAAARNKLGGSIEETGAFGSTPSP